MTELDLLREYAASGSDAAFEQLAARYLDLVYSAALRQVRDPHTAEDVLQAVFIILAKKAASLPRNVILPAWLLETTRLTALDALRRQDRQQRRERSAATMATTTQPTGEPISEILPFLDEALASLPSSDRSAVVLRFFDKRSLREVGDSLAISQSAADKRISRALERMRLFFIRRGVILSAGTLALALADRAVHAAPPEIAAALPTALLKAKAGLQASAANTIAQNALSTMAAAKTKLLAIWAAAALIFLTISAVGLHRAFWPAPESPVEVVTAATAIPTAPPDQNLTPEPPPAPVRTDNAPTVGDPVAINAAPEKNLDELPPRAPDAKTFIDLTATIDVDQDSINGEWTRENGALCSNSAFYAGIEIPYMPPREYDLRVTFTPIVARDSVYLILARAGQQFVWKMGAYGNNACLFELKDKQWPNNDTAFRQPGILQTGVTMTCVIEVRDAGVRAFLNDRLIVENPAVYPKLGTFGLWTPQYPGALGIGSWASPTRFEKIEVAEVTGRGANVNRLPEKARPPTQPLPDAAQWNTAEKLLPMIDLADTVSGKWTKTEAALVSDNSERTRIHIRYQPPLEYDLRVVAKRESSKGEIDIILPRANSAVSYRLFIPQWMAGFASAQPDGKPNATWCVMPDRPADNRWTTILRVRNDGIRAYINGKLISHLTPALKKLTTPPEWRLADRTCLGLGSDQKQTIFESIDLIPVTGTGKPLTTLQTEGAEHERF